MRNTPVAAIAILLLFSFLSDYLLVIRPFGTRELWAFFDGFAHGIIALIVLWPLYKGDFSNGLWLAVLLSVIIDIDHFLAAGSLSLYHALNLPLRPVTHSLTFAIAVGLLTLLLSRSYLAGWTVFAALASHVLRDAAGGITPVLWPLSLHQIPMWVYYMGETILLLGSSTLARII